MKPERDLITDARKLLDRLHAEGAVWNWRVHVEARTLLLDFVSAYHDKSEALLSAARRCGELEEENERLRAAFEVVASPDMWESVEGEVSGPDCEGHTDPYIWLGAGDWRHPVEAVRAALKGDTDGR